MMYRMASVYIEDNIQEFGVSHYWDSASIEESIITKRGTYLQMIRRPKWGLACYMDNSIQSCEVDEKLYHESLVHPVMSTSSKPKSVMIVGGGEGATAREVLRWPSVERVDMYDWDEEVVQVFREKYPQWAKGSWYDSRLHLHFVDIFETIKANPSEKYDVIIIDLFDPSDDNIDKWTTLLKSLHNWITEEGSIVMYSGMRNILEKEQPYHKLIDVIQNAEYWRGIKILETSLDKEIIPYKVYIPSFSGESTFLLLKNKDSKFNFEKCKLVNSHLTNDIWQSYKSLNW